MGANGPAGAPARCPRRAERAPSAMLPVVVAVTALVLARAEHVAAQSAPTSGWRAAGEVVAVENDYVRIAYLMLEASAPAADPRRPLPRLVYVRVRPAPGVLAVSLEAPPDARPFGDDGQIPRAVDI